MERYKLLFRSEWSCPKYREPRRKQICDVRANVLRLCVRYDHYVIKHEYHVNQESVRESETLSRDL